MKILAISTFLFLFSSSAFSLKSQLIFQDLGGVVWGLEFIDANTGLATLRNGKLLRLNFQSKTFREISGVPKSKEMGQGGLLDVALHPEFPKNQLVFFSYTQPSKGKLSTTALAVGKYNSAKNKVESLKTLFLAKPAYEQTHHYGSRIAFDGRGHLFLTVGDRGNRDYAQNLSRHNGKVMRLNLDGSVPKDNPFVGRKGALPEIWSYGHRNPQGMVFDKRSGTLWIHEHGPRGGDEINRIKKGANYGWPIITYGREYSGPKIGGGLTKKKGMEPPIKYYVPSIAPSGLELYQSGPISELKDSLLLGALALQHLNQVKIKNGVAVSETRHFQDLDERIRDVKQAPDKSLYFTTDSGRIFKVPASVW